MSKASWFTVGTLVFCIIMMWVYAVSRDMVWLVFFGFMAVNNMILLHWHLMKVFHT